MRKSNRAVNYYTPQFVCESADSSDCEESDYQDSESDHLDSDLDYDADLSYIQSLVDKKIDADPRIVDRNIPLTLSSSSNDYEYGRSLLTVGVFQQEFTCKHCNNTITSLDHVSDHSCFLGKEVYMHNNVLFTDTASNSTSYKINNTLSSQESLFQDQNQNQDQDHKKELNKQDAVWTKNKTLALISLYEANMNMLDNPRKKTKIWAAISRGLHDLDIKMSSDQVRWKVNYLTKKYKECVDNNLKSGRSPMSFEFFDEMENIFGYKKTAIDTYSISSNLPLKISKSSNIKMEIQSHTSKKQKINNLNYIPINTSPNNSASTSPGTSNKENKENERARIKSERKSTYTSSQLKNNFENFCLDYMQKDENRREEHNKNMLKTREEALKLKKHFIEMREKELEVKKTIAINKIKSKEKRHDELLDIEKLKCNLLKKLLNDKHFKDDSDSE